VKTIRLSDKDYRKQYGTGSGASHFTDESGEHIIVLPGKPSTKTRMHEIAHAELGHVGPAKTLGEAAKRELQADAWVYDKLGRTPSMYEIANDFGGLVEQAVDNGDSASTIFSWVMREIEEQGYTVSKENRSEIWWWIRGLYEKGHFSDEE
jgi:hypothetical protein